MAAAISIPAQRYNLNIAQALGGLLRYSNAEALQSRLDGLASAGSYDEAKRLYIGLVGDLLPNVKPNFEITAETLDLMLRQSLPDAIIRITTQKKFEEAASSARDDPLIFDGRSVENWGHGGGLVMDWNQKLKLEAYYDGAGVDQSLRSATVKAITSWFLDNWLSLVCDGSVEDFIRVVEKLKEIGVVVGFDPEKPHVYSGFISPVRMDDGQQHYFVGGRYYPSDDIRNALIKGTQTVVTNDTMAGPAESTLAYRTRQRLLRSTTAQKEAFHYPFLDELLRQRPLDSVLIEALS